MRGRWGSDGEFEPFLDEARDGLETIAWAASLPFSNGRVGMTGMSYPALAQLHAAAQNPEPLQAFAPIMAPADPYGDWVFTNGAFALAFTSAGRPSSRARPPTRPRRAGTLAL
jgi:putative CocE/NonD family hydrolase